MHDIATDINRLKEATAIKVQSQEGLYIHSKA